MTITSKDMIVVYLDHDTIMRALLDTAQSYDGRINANYLLEDTQVAEVELFCDNYTYRATVTQIIETSYEKR